MPMVLWQELLACVDGRTVMVDNTAKGKGRQDSVEALLSLAASAAVLDASASWLPPTAEHQVRRSFLATYAKVFSA